MSARLFVPDNLSHMSDSLSFGYLRVATCEASLITMLPKSFSQIEEYFKASYMITVMEAYHQLCLVNMK